MRSLAAIARNQPRKAEISGFCLAGEVEIGPQLLRVSLWLSNTGTSLPSLSSAAITVGGSDGHAHAIHGRPSDRTLHIAWLNQRKSRQRIAQVSVGATAQVARPGLSRLFSTSTRDIQQSMIWRT